MEPTEEAVDSFVSFTSTTRDQAIAFLKVEGPLPLPPSSLRFLTAKTIKGEQSRFTKSDQRVLRRSDWA
jgi:ribosomal protein S10